MNGNNNRPNAPKPPQNRPPQGSIAEARRREEARHRAAVEATRRTEIEIKRRKKVEKQRKKRQAALAKESKVRPQPQQRPQQAQPRREETYEQKLTRLARERDINAKKAVRRRESLTRLFLAIICGVLLYAAIMGIIIGLRTAYLHHTDRDKEYDITLSITSVGGGKAAKKTVSSARVFQGGQPCVCISDIAGMIGFTTAGAADGVMIFYSGEQYIRFENGTRTVTINGNAYIMPAPAKEIDGKLWIPSTFFDRYTAGLDIGYDTTTKVFSIAFARDEENSDSLHTKWQTFRLVV
jgi:hypothetical protein